MKILLNLCVSCVLIPISIMKTFQEGVHTQKKLKAAYFKQNHAVPIVFNKDKLIHLNPLLQKLNAPNVCQINIPALKLDL